MKKLLIALAAVVVVFGIALVIVVANLGRIVNSKKGDLLAEARARTGREISVGEVGVAVWPSVGVRVQDVVVGDDPAFSAEPFLRAKDVRINVALWPLIKKQVVLERVVLNAPEIVVIKGEGNRFNYTSLIESAAPPASSGGDGGGAKPGAGAAAVLAFADIKDGTVRYVDRAGGVDRVVRDIDLTAKGSDGGRVFDIELDAAVFGDDQDVHGSAKVGPLEMGADEAAMRAAPLSAMLTLDPVTIADLSWKPRAEGAAPPPEGTLGATATITGTLGAANVEPIGISATLFGAGEPNLEVSATAGPFDLLADSTLVFAAAQVKGSLTAGPLPLSGVKMKSADPAAPAPVLGGDAAARATFGGAMSAIVFDGEIDATNASYAIPAQMEKKPGIPAKAVVSGTFRPQGTPDEGIELAKIDVVVHALTATGRGRIVPFKGREAMEIALDGRTAIAPWNDVMTAMAPFKPAGDAAISLRVSGAPKPGAAPQVEGTAKVTGFSATLAQMPKPVSNGTATVAFTAKTARIPDARFDIGESRFRLEAEIPSFKPMQATYTLTSAAVNRADVQAPAPGAKPLPRPEVFRDVVAKGSMRETAPKMPENTLVLTSKTGVASNVDYTDFAADLRTTPEKVFIDRYSARAMGGALSGKGTFEPKIAKFDVDTKIEKVNLAEYFRYKSPALADVLVGRLDADITLGGQGKTWEDLQKTLAGSGGAVVLEGALLNVNIAEQLLTAIQGMPMVPAGLTQRMRARNPKLFAENKTAFQNLAGQVKIENGRILTPDLKLATSDFTLAGDGWFSFGKEMNMASTLTLSEKLTRDLVAEVPAVKYIVSPDGRLEVPLTLSGAVMKPAVTVDSKAMAAKLQKSLVGDGQQQIQEGLKGLLDGLGKKKEPVKKP